MLERLARIVVIRRRRFLIGALAITLICGFLALQVPINYDMTKYLPDSSSMKHGIDIMAEEFPEMATESSIRVMFDDLPPTERMTVFEALDAIPYVESVSYERDSDDFNKGNHTLFVVSVPYAYGSPEELAVEEAIDTGFAGYTMVWHNDDTTMPGLTLDAALIAVALLALILLLMCGSWIEPVLFLAVIGIAVVINLGTNIVMGEISGNSFQIGAILQLALSMDYSIILMSRYRQERGVGERSVAECEGAMISAFRGAFSSITASSLTTVVGLLMLCFMSFKIGADIGIVLAKGVFFSMVCVLLLLPGIIVACDGVIARSAKKTLHVNMDRVAGMECRLRWPLTAALVLLFVAVLILQSRTNIAYTLAKDDPVAEVFPADNMVLVVYDNADEGRIPALVEHLEADPMVKSVTAYATVLGKPYTVTELAKMLTSTGADLPIGEGILQMLYYDYFSEGEPPALTAGEFLRFLSGTVATDETFAEYLTPEMRESLETLGRFADVDNLITPYTAREMAAFLDMEPDDMENLYLLYFIRKGGVALPSMTLPTFVHFVLHEVAVDPEYASMFPAGSLSQLRRLETFTNASAMTTPRDYRSMASIMGLDAETAKLLYAYYMANQPGFDPGAVSRGDFMDFVNKDLLGSSLLENYVDAETLALIRAAASEAQSTDGTAQETPDQLAADMGEDVATVTSVMKLDAAGDVSARQMAVGSFLAFAEDTALGDPVVGAVWSAADASRVRMLRAAYLRAAAGEDGAADALAEALGADAATVQAILGGAAYTPAGMAAFLGLDGHAVSLTYGLAFAPDVSGRTMSRREFAEAALNVGAETALADSALAGLVTPEILSRIQEIREQMGADDASPVTYRDLMGLLGVDETTAKVICTMAASGREADSWRITCRDLVNFLVANSGTISAAMSASDLAQMRTLANVINGTVEGTSYTYQALAKTLGMTADQARQLYTLYASRHGNTAGWTITVGDLVHFLDDEVLTNEAYASRFDAETAAYVPALRDLVDAVISGRLYDAAGMAELLGAFSDELDPAMVELLFLYHASLAGADPTWRLSIEQLFTYLNEDLINDPRFAAVIDAEMRAQLRDAADQLAAGKAQLVTPNHARLIITSSYPEEGPDTLAFLADLDSQVAGRFAGEAHLVGNSVMMYEMQATFGKEFLFISGLTALAIFLIVALSFRSVIVPLILVLLVQCGVYATMCIIGWMSGSMFYLALLIVECILMGSTIDYGILMSTFYRESRATMDIRDALRASHAGSMHTILTSGTIIILVCGAMSFVFEEPSIGAI
ncbi:MAG: MMPL family transporter, partial [Eggerthellaceae bacterium]|nr:MMPL family transporter [Eggerthellaceae bacterium]